MASIAFNKGPKKVELWAKVMVEKWNALDNQKEKKMVKRKFIDRDLKLILFEQSWLGSGAEIF